MDLESVDDNNSVTQQSGVDGRSFDNGSCSDESVKLVSTTGKIDEVRSFDSYSPISKGRGLRKWRRIRRDLVQDTSTKGMEKNSKVLKRGSSGKQIQFQSLELEQGSVSMVNSSGDGYDSMFVSDKDDCDRRSSSKFSMAPQGFRCEKPRVENSKKHRGESVDIDKENSLSSLESDSRKQSGRMMDDDLNGESSKKKDDEEESINQSNSLYSEELDPLREAIDGFLSLQEALQKELEQLCEIGKEPIHHEGTSEGSSEIVTLVNNAEQLETKLEETRSMLEAKESHIRELESTTNQNRTQTVVEDIFRQKIESEIEYLIYSRSIDNLNSQVKSIEEQEEAHEETLNKLGEVETKAANLTNRAKDLQKECKETIKKRACKTASCFVIQLVLLLTLVFLLFMSQLLPESDIVVVPT